MAYDSSMTLLASMIAASPQIEEKLSSLSEPCHQDCWELLCSSDGLLADGNEDGLKEKLTDVLSGTLQVGFDHTSFRQAISALSSHVFLPPVTRSLQASERKHQDEAIVREQCIKDIASLDHSFIQ